MREDSIARQRQQPLVAEYLVNPEKAMITDVAVVESTNFDSPFHTQVSISEELEVPLPIGIHRGLGGYHDQANPGDMLSAALASCFESTLRIIASHLNVKLEATHVKVSAHVDLRGTLMMDRSIPVGFQWMDVDVQITAPTADEATITMLVRATEKCCVVYQTLKQGTPININIETPAAAKPEQ